MLESPAVAYNKACPVVLRLRESEAEILALRHPLAGYQLVKGTIEPAESLPHACARELWEESGLQASAEQYLGRWEAGFAGQVWGFYLMRLACRPPDSWEHYTTNGGGHIFSYFWQPLASTPGEEWHPLFQQAFAFVKYHLKPEYLAMAADWQVTWVKKSL
jgi:8-oxo-dGTP pyrophosphatase MutT (NUDIX family)